MKKTPKEPKKKQRKRNRKKMMKKTVACTMLTLALVPTFSSFLPNDETTQVDPKLAQAYLEAMEQEQDTVIEPAIEGTYEVVDILDDMSLSVLYDGSERTVKLIGVDVSQAGTEGNLEILLSDNYVDLEFDTQREDAEGNLLAYVYLENGMLLNEELLLNGQAVLKEENENVKYKDVLNKAQEDAKANRIGVWFEELPED